MRGVNISPRSRFITMAMRAEALAQERHEPIGECRAGLERVEKDTTGRGGLM